MPLNPRFEEDLHFEEVPGGPPRYRWRTDRPVQYLTMVDGHGTVLAYVWANDEDDAASWDPREAGGATAVNAGMLWLSVLRDAKARGLAPTAALGEIARTYGAAPEPVRWTSRKYARRALPGAPDHAPDLTVVAALAGPSGPARMTHPVHYAAVTAPDGEVIGYAWGDGGAGTVGWTRRAARSRAADEAGADWPGRVRAAHTRGLTPVAALAVLSAGDPAVGPVTGAPDLAAVEELARTVTPADDDRLLAQLHRERPDAWRELAEAFDALTDADREVRWGGGEQRPDGVHTVPYPVYTEALWRAVHSLTGVGAVTPEHRWAEHPLPVAPPGGRMHPADAVRAATFLLPAERISEGTLEEAVRSGLLDAVGAALRAWGPTTASVTPLAPLAPLTPLTLAEVEALARTAHAAQTDKAGRPYAEHLQAVAEGVRARGGGDELVAAAWLHDSVEDGVLGEEWLDAAALPQRTKDVVRAVTKRPGEAPEAYARRILATPGARLVKAADLAHNADPHRLADLDEATARRLTLKYAAMRGYLGLAAGD